MYIYLSLALPTPPLPNPTISNLPLPLSLPMPMSVSSSLSNISVTPRLPCMTILDFARLVLTGLRLLNMSLISSSVRRLVSMKKK
jgi:hypothetical protein